MPESSSNYPPLLMYAGWRARLMAVSYEMRVDGAFQAGLAGFSGRQPDHHAEMLGGREGHRHRDDLIDAVIGKHGRNCLV